MMNLIAESLGAKVAVKRYKYQRHLSFVGGVAGRLVPITLVYSGSKRRALREKEKIERYGYKVRIRREHKRKEAMPALPGKGSK